MKEPKGLLTLTARATFLVVNLWRWGVVGKLGKKFRGVPGAENFHNKVFSKVIRL